MRIFFYKISHDIIKKEKGVKMKKIAIIGGGASGLITAIIAKTKENEVVILEKNSQLGKKLLLTGNGKCNFWNEDQNLSHYHSLENVPLEHWLTEERQKEVLSFFQNLGIIWKTKNGWYYPFSNQAISIRNALEEKVRQVGVQIDNDFLVEDIKIEKNLFVINTKKESMTFDVVVLATGSKAYPKTGSTGDGYRLASTLGHSIIEPLPSLVPLVLDKKIDASGVRTDVKVSIYEDGKFLREEEGELQITDYGLSGICIFLLSRYASIGLANQKKMTLEINFIPFLQEEAHTWMTNISKNKKISSVLDGFLNYKLGNALLKSCHIIPEKTWENLEKEKQENLLEHLTHFKANIISALGYENGQICLGGIPLKEVTESFESKLIPNLYFTGELLDLDGDCGGYNLGIAWISGMTVGKEIARRK